MAVKVNISDRQLSQAVSETLKKLKSLGYDKAQQHVIINAVLLQNNLSLNDFVNSKNLTFRIVVPTFATLG